MIKKVFNLNYFALKVLNLKSGRGVPISLFSILQRFFKFIHLFNASSIAAISSDEKREYAIWIANSSCSGVKPLAETRL